MSLKNLASDQNDILSKFNNFFVPFKFQQKGVLCGALKEVILLAWDVPICWDALNAIDLSFAALHKFRQYWGRSSSSCCSHPRCWRCCALHCWSVFCCATPILRRLSLATGLYSTGRRELYQNTRSSISLKRRQHYSQPRHIGVAGEQGNLNLSSLVSSF